MADGRIKLLFEIVTDDKKFKSVLNDFEKQVKASDIKARSLSSTFSKFRTSLNNLPVSIIKSFGSSIANAALNTAKLGAALATAFAGFQIKRAIDEAISLENALTGLNSVARNTGNDVDFITEAAKELAADGLIPLTDVADSLKNLLATGLDADQAVKTFKSLRDAAAFNRQGQLELGEAIRGASEGLKNDLSIKVDNAGVTKNLSVILKEYAASIGKTIGTLTDAERIQAKFVGIQKEAALFQGDYNVLLTTFSGALSEVGGRYRFLVAEAGQLITQNPFVIATIKTLATQFGILTQRIKQNRTFLTDLINEGIIKAVKGFSTFLKILDNINTVISLNINSFKILSKILTLGTLTSINLIIKGIDKLKTLLSDNVLGRAVGDATQAFKDLGSGILDFGESLIRKAGIGALADDIKDKSKEISNSVNKIAKDIDLEKSIDQLIKGINNDFDDLTNDFQGRTLLGDASDQVDVFAVDLKKSLSKVKDLKVPAPRIEKPKPREVNTFLDDLVSGIGGGKFSKSFGAAITSTITNLGSALSQGRAGAKSLASGLVKSFASAIPAIGPILGGAIGSITDFLLSDPESAKKQISEFFDELPNLVENLANNLPFFIEKLTTGLNDAFVRVSERADIIAEALVQGFIQALPRIIESQALLGPKLAQGVAESFVNGIKRGVDNVGNIFSKLFRFDGGGKGPVEKFLGFDFPFLKFADGGLVPGKSMFNGDSLKNDTVPSLLSPGEIVLPRTAVNGGMPGIVDFLKSIGVPQFGLGGKIFKGFGRIFKSAAQILEERIKAATNLFGGVRDLDFQKIVSDFSTIPRESLQNVAAEKLEKFGNKALGGTDYNRIINNLGLDDLLTASSFILPKNLREILESMKNVGLKINVTDLIRDPISAIENTVRNQKEVFKPFFLQTLRKFPGLSNGGVAKVPSNFLDDSFPARLQSGEMVVDRTLTNQLGQFLANQNNSGDQVTNQILGSILEELRKPMKAESTVELNRRAFADILIDLSRSNTRLAI